VQCVCVHYQAMGVRMLPQAKADLLLELVKLLVDRGTIEFPNTGELKQLHLTSDDGRESFIVDVNRKGRIKISKCTYQERYQVLEILLRLDIDGPPHDNPDGATVPCPHLHIYKEGFADKWAYPINPTEFTNTGDLVTTLKEFLEYCNVKDIPPIQGVL
jgi:hypothetical protein